MQEGKEGQAEQPVEGPLDPQGLQLIALGNFLFTHKYCKNNEQPR